MRDRTRAAASHYAMVTPNPGSKEHTARTPPISMPPRDAIEGRTSRRSGPGATRGQVEPVKTQPAVGERPPPIAPRRPAISAPPIVPVTRTSGVSATVPKPPPFHPRARSSFKEADDTDDEQATNPMLDFGKLSGEAARLTTPEPIRPNVIEDIPSVLIVPDVLLPTAATPIDSLNSVELTVPRLDSNEPVMVVRSRSRWLPIVALVMATVTGAIVIARRTGWRIAIVRAGEVTRHVDVQPVSVRGNVVAPSQPNDQPATAPVPVAEPPVETVSATPAPPAPSRRHHSASEHGAAHGPTPQPAETVAAEATDDSAATLTACQRGCHGNVECVLGCTSTAAPATLSENHDVAPAIPATPARADVARGLDAIAPALRACAHGIAATATTRITFDAAGHVSNATFQPPFGGSPVDECMVTAVRQAHIPPFSSAPFVVTYPFALR